MNIKFYNSLSNSLEDFNTQQDKKVSMYVCGPTVYNYPHIGNMRPVVVFDTLRRFLTYVGYKVTYVSNFTDVDDKIIKAAKQEGKSEKELTDFYIAEFEKTIKMNPFYPEPDYASFKYTEVSVKVHFAPLSVHWSVTSGQSRRHYSTVLLT